MSTDIKLGQLAPTVGVRDAVHVAVVSVTAAHSLSPGEGVVIHRGEAYGEQPHESPIGIVDPWLKDDVKAGQIFWLFLKPGTVSSLRHVWAHPAFPLPETESEPDPAIERSRKWILEYANKLNVTYDTLMYYANKKADAGDDLYWNDYLVGGCELEGEHTSEEFWAHFAVVTGKAGKGNFFSCSC